MGKKHEKIKFDYTKYFNFTYSCKQCGLNYPEDELKKGICLFCREENDKIDKLLDEINIINNRIKMTKLKMIKHHYLNLTK